MGSLFKACGAGAVDGLGSLLVWGRSPGLGSRGGSLLAGWLARLPGMAGVRTFRFLLFPVRVASSSSVMGSTGAATMAGNGTGAAQCPHTALPPSVPAGASTIPQQAGQGSRSK